MRHARKDYQERIIDLAGLIPDREPVLLLRAQDVAALPTILAYVHHAARAGAAQELIDSVARHAELFRLWQQDHRVHVPDLPEGAIEERPADGAPQR